MSFVDQPSGWQWRAMVATALAQAGLLAVFAVSLHVTQTLPDGPDVASLVAFDLSPPPMEVGAEVAAKPATARPVPPSPVPASTARQQPPIWLPPPQQPRPSALPQQPGATGGQQGLQQPVGAAAPPVLPSPPPPGASAPPPADPLATYAAALRQRIMARLPRGLQRAGVVTIAFTVNPAGGMNSAQVAQSSGDVQMDRTALRMVRAAAPFPAPPADLAEARLRFSIEVRFH